MISLESAIKRIAERTYDNTRNWQKNNYQRRSKVVDSSGVEYSRTVTANKPAKLYWFVSQDFLYYERFQFKLYVDAQTTSKMTFKMEIDGTDITPYLMAQYDWADGSGSFPKQNSRFYDILKVASDMYGEYEELKEQGKEQEAKEMKEKADQLTKANEEKEVVITANGTADIDIKLILKYSYVNR